MKQETKKKKYDFEIEDEEDEEVDGKETFSEISFRAPRRPTFTTFTTFGEIWKKCPTFTDF